MASASANVTILEEVVLQCADESAVRTLESPVLLGPLDHINQFFTPIMVVFVYRKEDTATRELLPLHRLQRALRRLLDYYPHLTGRVVMDKKDQTPRIEQLGAGGKLISATCNDPLEAYEALGEDDKPGSSPRLIVTTLPDGGKTLLPPFDPTEAGMARDPILAVQHTRFACGGVSIGFCLRHIICDAAGFFQLVRDLAELYRGFRDIELELKQSSAAAVDGPSTAVRTVDLSRSAVKLSRPPHIRSYMAELHAMTPEERQAALDYEPTILRILPEVEKAAIDTTVADKPIPPRVSGRVLRFSKDELAALKAEANAGNAGPPLSTFCALTAHLWQSIYRARVSLCEAEGMSSMEASLHVSCQLIVSMNICNRSLLKDMPSEYFPNGVLCPVVCPPADQLQNGSLMAIATSIRDGFRQQDQTEMEQTLRWIAAQPDKQRVQPRYNNELGGIIVTQWSKFDMYRKTEFDAVPALVGQPFTPFTLYDGLAYYLATEDQLEQNNGSPRIITGSVDINLALAEPVWGILDNDPGFRHRTW